MIEAVSVTKRFGDVTALDGLDLVVDPGQVVAILGPNGAGKSTLVRTVATLTKPDSGELRVSGVDVVTQAQEVRRLIGLAGQSAAVEEAMTGRENLVMVARLFGFDRKAGSRAADVVLDQLGLSEASNRLVRTYSGGMRRRLDLGASLVGRPRTLLLDEPTTGLDPRSRTELWTAIRDLVAAGTNVLLTTQYLEEADQLASEIVVIDRGKVIAAGTPAELKKRAGNDIVEVTATHRADIAQLVTTVQGAANSEPWVDEQSHAVRARVQPGAATMALAAVVRAVDAQRIDISDIALRRPSLDEVFLALTGSVATEPANKPTEPHDDSIAA